MPLRLVQTRALGARSGLARKRKRQAVPVLPPACYCIRCATGTLSKRPSRAHKYSAYSRRTTAVFPAYWSYGQLVYLTLEIAPNEDSRPFEPVFLRGLAEGFGAPIPKSAYF